MTTEKTSKVSDGNILNTGFFNRRLSDKGGSHQEGDSNAPRRRKGSPRNPKLVLDKGRGDLGQVN